MEHIQLKIWKPTLTNSDFPTVKLQIGPKKKVKQKRSLKILVILRKLLIWGWRGEYWSGKLEGKLGENREKVEQVFKFSLIFL